MGRKSLIMVIMLAVVLMSSNSFAALIELRATDPGIVDPTTGEIIVPVCTEFDVEVYMSGLTGTDLGLAEGLVSYTMGIVWDPLVEVVSVSSGDWEAVVPNETEMPDRFLLAGSLGAATEPISTDHVMATLTLHCLIEGVTELLPEGQFPGPFNFALDNAMALDDEMSFQGITIRQTVVPIPSAMLLLGSGLLGLVGIRRKK